MHIEIQNCFSPIPPAQDVPPHFVPGLRPWLLVLVARMLVNKNARNWNAANFLKVKTTKLNCSKIKVFYSSLWIFCVQWSLDRWIVVDVRWYSETEWPRWCHWEVTLKSTDIWTSVSERNATQQVSISLVNQQVFAISYTSTFDIHFYWSTSYVSVHLFLYLVFVF